MADLQGESVALLQRLIRVNTVNPPGNERALADLLGRYLANAGLEIELLGRSPARANLIATLAGESAGRTLALLGHLDTVAAEPGDWRHDPFGGELAEGCVWGRGAIDMKGQVAAEAVAAAALARDGWRPAHGTLKLIFVADEEVSSAAGARWLTERHPDRVRCDLLLNEGGGSPFDHAGSRYYPVGCGEKGAFGMRLTAHGVAGHASLPHAGDNALLKLAPVLDALRAGRVGYDPTAVPLALIEALGEDGSDLDGALTRIGRATPGLGEQLEAQLCVTMTPTIVVASSQLNVIPARASVSVDTRVPPGLGSEVARARMRELLGAQARAVEIEPVEQIPGSASAPHSALMDTIEAWVARRAPGARAVPTLSPGYSDSSYFRAAFPDLVAYGFFPQRHQTAGETSALMHNADERIDVRDLGFATGFFRDIVTELLG